MATAMNRTRRDGVKKEAMTATKSNIGKILSVHRNPSRRTQRLVPKRDIKSDRELVACATHSKKENIAMIVKATVPVPLSCC